MRPAIPEIYFDGPDGTSARLTNAADLKSDPEGGESEGIPGLNGQIIIVATTPQGLTSWTLSVVDTEAGNQPVEVDWRKMARLAAENQYGQITKKVGTSRMIYDDAIVQPIPEEVGEGGRKNIMSVTILTQPGRPA